jgi:hypothetical protein
MTIAFDGKYTGLKEKIENFRPWEGIMKKIRVDLIEEN